MLCYKCTSAEQLYVQTDEWKQYINSGIIK